MRRIKLHLVDPFIELLCISAAIQVEKGLLIEIDNKG